MAREKARLRADAAVASERALRRDSVFSSERKSCYTARCRDVTRRVLRVAFEPR